MVKQSALTRSREGSIPSVPANRLSELDKLIDRGFGDLPGQRIAAIVGAVHLPISIPCRNGCPAGCRKKGKDRSGRQCYACRTCGAWHAIGLGRRRAGIEQRRETIARVRWRPGMSMNEVAAALKLSTDTVSRAVKALKMQLPACQCGRRSGHRGWCTFRLNKLIDR